MKAYPLGDFKTIDEYISLQPESVRGKLEEIRREIKKAAPMAEEVISYSMPAFRFKGMLVYFAAFKNHIGFYPTNSGIETFKNEIDGYKSSKGAVQFPLDKPLPLDLIRRIVEFRVKENITKEETKRTLSKAK